MGERGPGTIIIILRVYRSSVTFLFLICSLIHSLLPSLRSLLFLPFFFCPPPFTLPFPFHRVPSSNTSPIQFFFLSPITHFLLPVSLKISFIPHAIWPTWRRFYRSPTTTASQKPWNPSSTSLHQQQQSPRLIPTVCIKKRGTLSLSNLSFFFCILQPLKFFSKATFWTSSTPVSPFTSLSANLTRYLNI